MTAHTGVVELEAVVVRRWIEEGEPLVLLDIRNDEAQRAEPRSDWWHIPFQLLPSRLDQLPRNCRIVLYCQIGIRSLAAARYLREAGFEAFCVRGGLTRWQETTNLTAAMS